MFTGTPPNVDVVPLIKTLTVQAAPENMPKCITIDLSSMGPDAPANAMFVGDVILPVGVVAMDKLSMPVAEVKGATTPERSDVDKISKASNIKYFQI